MTEFPELHALFGRPSEDETRAALERLRRTPGARRPPLGSLLRTAAVLAGLAVAYGVGFAVGRRDAATHPDPDAADLQAATFVVRPPVLIARPRS